MPSATLHRIAYLEATCLNRRAPFSYSAIFPTLITTRDVKFPRPGAHWLVKCPEYARKENFDVSIWSIAAVITLTGFHCMSVSRGDGRYYVSAVYLGVNRSLSLSGHWKNHHQTVWHRCAVHVTYSVRWTHYQHHVSHVNYPRLITEICHFAEKCNDNRLRVSLFLFSFRQEHITSKRPSVTVIVTCECDCERHVRVVIYEHRSPFPWAPDEHWFAFECYTFDFLFNFGWKSARKNANKQGRIAKPQAPSIVAHILAPRLYFWNVFFHRRPWT